MFTEKMNMFRFLLATIILSVIGSLAFADVVEAATTYTRVNIATEGKFFRVTGTQTVRYGSATRFIERAVTGSGWCNNRFFRADPAPYRFKGCSIVKKETKKSSSKKKKKSSKKKKSGSSSVVADAIAPTAPSELLASAVSSSQINLSWTASADNVGVAFYQVERCSGATCSPITQVATPTVNTYSDTGLTALTSYSYRIRAVDAKNNQSGYSGVATDTTLEAVAAQYTLTLTISGIGTVTSSPANINCTSSCSADFSSGTIVTLTALPGPSHLFSGWSGEGCSGTGTCVTTMSGAKAISVAFERGQSEAELLVVGPTDYCAEGVTITDLADMPVAASLFAPDTGILYTPNEVDIWRARMVSGPYKSTGDAYAGSPNDFDKIRLDADAQVANPESLIQFTVNSASAEEGTFGFKTRDAALLYLLTGDTEYRDAAKSTLLGFFSAEANARTFFDVGCFRALPSNPAVADAYFSHAQTISRLTIAYDFVRSGLSESEKRTIENGLRRYGYFFAAQIQGGPTETGIGGIFPQRQNDNYAVRGRNANPSINYPAYLTEVEDTDNDCVPDGPAYDTYTHINADGSLGNRISYVSLYFNNRRARLAYAVAMIGAVLDDETLLDQAVRYTKEWLTYGVYPDGSQGEFNRNGNYCEPQAGRMYASNNIDQAILTAEVLARRGDMSLYNFSTAEGLFGTEGGNKSIGSVVDRYFSLISRATSWYYQEPWKTTQEPREATHLGKLDYYYMGTPIASQSWHDLSFLPYVVRVGNTPWKDMILRKPESGLPALGSRYNGGTPSFGPNGGVSDTGGILPSMLFLFEQ